MAPRADLGPADVARLNADVFITAGYWLTRPLLPAALACAVVASVMGGHDHAALTPGLWVHHLGAGYATASLQHLVITLAVVLAGVTLESLVLCRDAFARGAPGAVTALLAAAWRLLPRTRRLALPLVAMPALRRTSADDDPGRSILQQLCSALAAAPLGPPTFTALASDPRGPFGQSVQQAEVCAAP